MPFGPFALQWRAPSTNPPTGTPLPSGITRSYVKTPSGPLELLSAIPSTPNPSRPPLFFAHGGFGCASVWLPYMTFFSSRGYACYAVSYRGHGGSWYPGFWSMYFTGRHAIGEDLVAGIQEVEKLETERRKSNERVRVVLVSHSAGGALSQYVLSRGMCVVQGFCMLAAVPGFGSWSCYKFWFLSAPINFYYRCFHSKYLMATTKQVKDAFFTSDTPNPVVKDLERLLSPYESMCWPMQALSPFVTGPDVLSRITGWSPRGSSGKTNSPAGITPRLLVVAAEHDVLCTPPVLEDAAKRYRVAFHHCVRIGKLDGVSESDARLDANEQEGEDRDGVAYVVVKGIAHHLQNHENWQSGAEVLLRWTEKL
ncbi:Alpha/Beta hydrolase protein [Paraphoma chrysanthemicola]|uniref:Alpha/Beta hydrolase protein n=1 Tax=Paraphoma chrysanthemicola TaxID=798071 RepID=A0A8K0RB54_9PLEO|nr:Alpha/Beta hydrolase protein [Paraphoma chrysanthemicola]